MAIENEFGAFVREKRMALGLALREFCRLKGLDWAYLSKVERGKAAPPKSRESLAKYARALELREGTEDWQTFHDLAAICTGTIPHEIMSNEEQLAKLPLVFRTIRGDRLTANELAELASMIRES